MLLLFCITNNMSYSPRHTSPFKIFLFAIRTLRAFAPNLHAYILWKPGRRGVNYGRVICHGECGTFSYKSLGFILKKKFMHMRQNRRCKNQPWNYTVPACTSMCAKWWKNEWLNSWKMIFLVRMTPLRSQIWYLSLAYSPLTSELVFNSSKFDTWLTQGSEENIGNILMHIFLYSRKSRNREINMFGWFEP